MVRVLPGLTLRMLVHVVDHVKQPLASGDLVAPRVRGVHHLPDVALPRKGPRMPTPAQTKVETIRMLHTRVPVTGEEIVPEVGHGGEKKDPTLSARLKLKRPFFRFGFGRKAMKLKQLKPKRTTESETVLSRSSRAFNVATSNPTMVHLSLAVGALLIATAFAAMCNDVSKKDCEPVCRGLKNQVGP